MAGLPRPSASAVKDQFLVQVPKQTSIRSPVAIDARYSGSPRCACAPASDRSRGATTDDAKRKLEPVDVTAEVDRFFDASSLADHEQPKFALIMGPTAVGKSRHRRANYATGHVVIDAADIFISLSRGKYVDFPSVLEVPMDIVGATTARRAVRERRNIVTEVIGHKFEPTKCLIDAMLAIGYKLDIVSVQKDAVEAWEWNLQRSSDNISAFYAESFHRRWLIGAAAEPR